jgi:thiosulfate dehydrogenase [quinone] large subunit
LGESHQPVEGTLNFLASVRQKRAPTGTRLFEWTDRESMMAVADAVEDGVQSRDWSAFNKANAMKQTLRQNTGIVSLVAALISLIGGMLLHVAADPKSSAGEAVWSMIIGFVLLVVVGGALFALNQPGTEVLTEDEVPIPEAHFSRFLRASKFAAALYIGIRLSMAYEWLTSGWAKAQNPAWVQTGTALQSFWQKAVAVPAAPAQPLITYPAYRAFIQYMLDHGWYVAMGKLIPAGELLIGLALLLGAFTGIAALAGLFMNFNFMYAGSTSVNPTLILLEAILIFGWRVAGWYGLDRYLLRWLGAPWAHGEAGTPIASETRASPS